MLVPPVFPPTNSGDLCAGIPPSDSVPKAGREGVSHAATEGTAVEDREEGMRSFGLWIVALTLAGAVLAADPPDLVRYQGVLRDAADAPLEGDFDMVVRLWNAASGGDEILVDSHTGASAVPVTGGMFVVQCGGGSISDGTGPGVYTTLHQVFADHSEVWLELQVGGETLSPRFRVVAVPYAANATYLAGEPADHFLDTRYDTQAKAGKLVLGQESGTTAAYGLEAYEFAGGGYFEDTDGSGNAHVGERFYGVRAWGNSAGGYFDDTNGSGYGLLGNGNYGARSFGATAGGRFEDTDDNGYALLGFGDRGTEARGNSEGGYFEDLDETGYVRFGSGHTGLVASGTSAGGLFVDSDDTGFSYLSSGGYGIRAYGDELGGYFEDLLGGSHASVASGHRGIEAVGAFHGGYFEDLDGSGYAYLGRGAGILAYGDEVAGYFENTIDGSLAQIARHERGVEASGSTAGGEFHCLSGSGHAYLGYGNRGVSAFGGDRGGWFKDQDSDSHAYVAYDDIGVYAWGDTMGGHFEDADSSGYAFVGYGDRGIWAKGTSVGGTLSHPDDVTYWADVARIRDAVTYKIRGTGAVSFVQNHPEDRERLIVYAAPEGDEVAVYTRGAARLTDGEARVQLGETFSLVANPDVGLTAHLTARGEAAALAVAGLSTSELIVRGPPGSDAAFDYLVYGLRLGFEEHCPADVRDREAFLPPREAARQFYDRHPELRKFNALQRFRGMRTATGMTGEPDLSRAEALVAAIDANRDDPDTTAQEESLEAGPAMERRTWLPVATEVEAGEVLALHPELPGVLRRAMLPADPAVIGVAAGPSRERAKGGLEAPVEVTGIVEVFADAGYGEIRPGDALVASPTAGRAMRASHEVPGTILGRAIDPLPSGTGAVRALLVMQ
jgi:hypothetical protein